MKFLPKEFEGQDLIPTNIIYDNPSDYSEPDVLTIVCKDLNNGHKIVHQITNPEIEVYIAKPEFRDPNNELYYDYCRDWFKKEDTIPVKVKYRSRWFELAKLLNTDKDSIKKNPYIFMADFNIENYYLLHFVTEYPTTKIPELHLGYLDIENDIINIDGFPEYGIEPINLVTYIDAEAKTSYTFILAKDNIREDGILGEGYDRESLKASFYKQVEDFKAHQEEFQNEIHEMFDELYGEDFKYNFLMYEDELEMLTDLWNIIKVHCADFIQIWNAPYDMMNLLLRLETLGADPALIINDDRIKHTFKSYYVEDRNPVVHKRKHVSHICTISSFVDDMVHYAGIRSVGGKLPSTRLSFVAKRELKDDKYDYSEDGDLKHLFYNSFKKAVIYNLKDVLLQYGIELKTSDMDTIYSRLYKNLCLPMQAFTTTLLVLHSFTLFAWERGYVIGVNRNKGNKGIIKYKNALDKMEAYIDEDANEFDINDLIGIAYDEDDDEEDSSNEKGKGKDKKQKFQGAFVMNPLYMSPTGTKILGKDSKYVHDYVADEDIGSEYPTAAETCNISNETLIGKVYLDNEDEIDIPIYDAFEFLGEEKKKYKIDKSNFLMEALSEKQYIEVGKIFMGLPDPSEIIKIIEEDKEKYINGQD